MRVGRFFLILLLLILVGIGGFFVYAYRPAIAEVARPDAGGFDPKLVQKGSEVAALGNCNVCHTAEGGRTFAGGLAIPTPFGVVYSTNITPDETTGIGRWPEEAFRRAMREGVDRAGNHLYPAFPYDHYTLLTDEDIRALYAYMMTRPPAAAADRENELRFPYNIRPILAGWKLLFLTKGPYVADASKSAEWNRGAYLVEGGGHCGSCHTPRNAFGAERKGAHLAGAPVEGWYAYAINAASPAPIPWTAESIAEFMKNGYNRTHGMARGPMAPVVGNTGVLPDADLRAIGVYLASLMGEPSAERKRRAEELMKQDRGNTTPQSGDSQVLPGASPVENHPGAAIYAAACASCHESGRPVPFGGLDLARSTAIHGPNPKNIVNVVLFGIPQAEGEQSGVMPGFDATLSERQLADLLAYLRTRYAKEQPAWTGVEELIREARSGAGGLRIYAADGTSYAPADTSQRKVPQ